MGRHRKAEGVCVHLNSILEYLELRKVSFIELSLVFLIIMESLHNAYAFSKRWHSHVTSSPVHKLLESS